MAKPIERLVASLTTAPRQQHWALADSALLQAITLGLPVQRGPRGRRLTQLMHWGDHLGLARAILLLTGGLELLRLLRLQGPAVEAEYEGCDLPKQFFVGFGAGPEEALFLKYTNEQDQPVARLSQIDVATFARWQRLGLFTALRALWSAQKAAWGAVNHLPKASQCQRIQFLTFAAMRLGHYSYMRAWFQRLRDQRPQLREVCFLAADTAAFAAVDAGIPTRYLQHGLVRHSLIVPCFDQIDALTRDELQHFKDRLPRSAVRLVQEPRVGEMRRSGGVLITSVYGDRSELARIVPFLQWAIAQDLTVWVRPHPCEKHRFWAELPPTLPVRIEDVDPTIQSALQRLRPSLVVSWFSTSLSDALQQGVIPVTVTDATSANVQDMVYPLLRRTLQWPKDHAEIAQVMQDDSYYNRTLSRLREIEHEEIDHG